MTQPTPRCAIVLTRISDARDGDEQGVNRQEKDGRLLADRLEWTVGPAETHVIVENDTSAYKRRKVCRSCLYPERACTCPPLPNGGKRETVLRTWRPGFRRALEMLRTGQADGLIALDLDRACRDPRDLEDLIDTVESRSPRIPVESVTGSLRLGSDGDITMGRVLVAVANKSSRDTGRRVARKRQEKAAMGEYGGNQRAYGWGVPKLDRATGEPLTDEKTGRPLLDMGKLVEAEAAEVRTWADQVLAGVSLREITADLRERGVPTVKGGDWGTWTVRDILLRPRNCGLAVYQVRETLKAYRDRGEPPPYDAGVIPGVTGSWEPIMDEDTWRAVAVLLTDPSRRTSPGGTPRWLGSLLYKCGVCAAAGTEQTVFVNGAVNGRGPSYFCRGPVGHLRRSVPGVDGYVTDVIVARLSQPDAAGLITPQQGPDRDTLSREANRLREAKANVLSLVASGDFTPGEARQQVKPITDRLAQIDAQLAVTVARSPLDALPLGTDKVREVWERLPLGSQRAIIRLLVDVTLGKGRPGRAPLSVDFKAHAAECMPCRRASKLREWNRACSVGLELRVGTTLPTRMTASSAGTPPIGASGTRGAPSGRGFTGSRTTTGPRLRSPGGPETARSGPYASTLACGPLCVAVCAVCAATLRVTGEG